jgi:prevent-host-death family protein
MTQTIEVSDIREELEGLLDRVFRGEARVLVEKTGVPVAVIVSPEDWRRFAESELRRRDRFAILDEIGAAFKDVPLEEIEQETTKALAEVRAEMRAERMAAAGTAVGE